MMVRNLVSIQDAYINTYHPDFMGGANSIINVFDINTYGKEHLDMMNIKKHGDSSFEDMVNGAKTAFKADQKSFGADVIIKKQSDEETKHQQLGGALNDGMGGGDDYEIQKYMQKDIKPVHLPDMPTYMRAEN